MATITPLDRIFIRVTQNGVLKYFSEISGVSSFNDIVSLTRRHLAGVKGMTTFDVRNTTGGWSVSRPVLFMQ